MPHAKGLTDKAFEGILINKILKKILTVMTISINKPTRATMRSRLLRTSVKQQLGFENQMVLHSSC
jgi:hypothetical protein